MCQLFHHCCSCQSDHSHDSCNAVNCNGNNNTHYHCRSIRHNKNNLIITRHDRTRVYVVPCSEH